MPPDALSTLYAEADDVYAILSLDGVFQRVDDNRDGGVDAGEYAWMTTYALNYATNYVNNFLLGRYSVEQLAADWTVNEITSVLAAVWLCRRRGNSVPASLDDWMKEVKDFLLRVKEGELMLGDTQERMSPTPYMANVRVSIGPYLKRARVERAISDQRPDVPPYSPNSDYWARGFGAEP